MMNPRIEQLLLQVASRAGEDGEYLPSLHTPEDIERFARLIVRECIGVVEGGSFLHDQAPTAIFARECGGAIKRHFGVEE
jgi:hypothetical protein